MNNYLIFDIGGTSVKFAIANEVGEFQEKGKRSTPKDCFESLLKVLKEIYLQYKHKYLILGIAISSSGVVDSINGIIHGLSAIPYILEFPICDVISKSLDNLPVSIENDANCAALGEVWLGIANSHSDIACIICGSGIGGAIVKDKKIHKGCTMNSGEFGNFPICKTEDGAMTNWSYYSIVRLAERYSKKLDKKIDGFELVRLAKNGDVLANSYYELFCYYVALGCIIIQFSYDPELIVLGGAISEEESLLVRINNQIDLICEGQEFGYIKPRIVRCKNGSDANLYGALYHFLYQNKVHIS